MTNVPKRMSGFTFIEVLIVVAIVGILSAILIANYSNARENARDKVRKSELKELQLALELYKAQHGRYPAAGCGATPGSQWAGPGPQLSWAVSCNEYISGLVPTFIPALPTDPVRENETGLGYIYITDAGGTMYKVIIHQTVESLFVRSQAEEFARKPERCGVSPANLHPTEYAIYSAGYECL